MHVTRESSKATVRSTRISVVITVWLMVGQAAFAQDLRSAASQRVEYVATMLNVESASVTQLQMSKGIDQSLRATIILDGERRTLVLTPHSVRSPGFTVRKQLPDGSYAEIAPPPSSTMRGTVLGIDGSVVAASLKDGGLFARVILPDGSERWIEPLASRDAQFEGSEYAVYRGNDVIPSGGTCEALAANEADVHAIDPGNDGSIANAAGGTSYIVEVAVDMDVEFWQEFGSDQGAIDQIENIINLMNLQYMREVDIRHDISSIIVRSAEPDPYSSFSAGSLLGQFRNHWNSSQTGVQRDIAHFFTGKEIDGSTIGIAWVGVICSSSLGYGLVQPNCCGSMACATDLSAHELGHNWAAGHCSCNGWTMNSGLQCANRFHPTSTVPTIVSYRNSRSCLTTGAPFPCASLAAPSADASAVPTNRYISFQADNPGQISAIRITLDSLPPPFDIANGRTMWLGIPDPVSENSGISDPDSAPGYGVFQHSTLRCNPVYLDWASFGTIYVSHEFIVPGGRYLLQEVDAICTFDGESVFSAPLQVTTSAVWADVVEDCEAGICGPPDGLVNVTTDLVAMLDKFLNKPGSANKVRMDIQPSTPDHVVSVQEISLTLDAFRGQTYPFVPGSIPCD